MPDVIADKIEYNGIEEDAAVYLDDLQLYAADYIERNSLETPEEIKRAYLPMLHYIFSNISYKVNIRDIKDLNRLFISYIGLCDTYGIIPSIDIFESFIDIYKHKFGTMMSLQKDRGEKANREYIRIYKRWLSLCKGRLTNSLTQEKGSDVNRIFIAKAVYGMAETTAQTPEEIEKRTSGEIGGRYLLD